MSIGAVFTGGGGGACVTGLMLDGVEERVEGVKGIGFGEDCWLDPLPLFGD